MKSDAQRLDERVLSAIRPCVGRRLQSVFYCCPADPDECETEDLHDPDLDFGAP